MKRNDCELVKDLLLNYYEGTVSDSTKEFVEEHLKTCQSCKEALEIIREEEKKEEEKEKTKEKFEIKYLLKIKKSSRKSIIISSIVLLLVMVTCVVQPLYSKMIATQIDKGISQIEKNDNFKIIITYKDLARDKEYEEAFYYKDGKYKIKEYIYPFTGDVLNYYTYGKKGNEIVTTVFEHKKLILKEKNANQDNQNGKHITRMFSFMSDYRMDTYPIGIRIKNVKYEEKKCYLISSGFGNDYSNLWVDKETMLPIKEISSWVSESTESNPSSGYFKKEQETRPQERYYKVEYNTVTDEDVAVPSEEGYTIEQYY